MIGFLSFLVVRIRLYNSPSCIEKNLSTKNSRKIIFSKLCHKNYWIICTFSHLGFKVWKFETRNVQLLLIFTVVLVTSLGRINQVWHKCRNSNFQTCSDRCCWVEFWQQDIIWRGDFFLMLFTFLLRHHAKTNGSFMQIPLIFNFWRSTLISTKVEYTMIKKDHLRKDLIYNCYWF